MDCGPCDPDHASLLTHHVPSLPKLSVPVASLLVQTGFVQVLPPEEEPPELLPEEEDDDPLELPELLPPEDDPPWLPELLPAPDDEPLGPPELLLPPDDELPELPELLLPPDDELPELPELPPSDVESLELPEPLPSDDEHPVATAATAKARKTPHALVLHGKAFISLLLSLVGERGARSEPA